jgi:hypothetical protein
MRKDSLEEIPVIIFFNFDMNDLAFEYPRIAKFVA